MHTFWNLWLILLAPLLFGFRMADDAGGGAGGASGAAAVGEATWSGEAAAPLDARGTTLNQPLPGSMTVGGRVYTAEEIHAAANPPKEGGEGGGEKKETATQTVKTKDPASEGLVPRDRYNQVTQLLRETRILAGLDPDTGKPKVAEAAAAAGDAGGKKPGEFAKGQEPWAKDLVPLPKMTDKDEKGNDKYDSTEAFLEALSDAKAHNKTVELLGKRDLANQTAQSEAQKQQQAQRDNQAVHKFTTEAIPAALVARGLLKEGALPQEIGPAFDAALKPLTALPPMERQSAFLYNFAVKQAQTGADLLLAVAEEAKTPEGVAHIMKLGALDDNAMFNELIAMDRLVSLGLTIRGKPRPAAQKLGANGKPLTNGNGAGNAEHINPSPGTNGSGAATDMSGLSGEALHRHLEAERDAKNAAILGRYKKA